MVQNSNVYRKQHPQSMHTLRGYDKQAIASLDIWLGRAGLAELAPQLRKAALQ